MTKIDLALASWGKGMIPPEAQGIRRIDMSMPPAADHSELVGLYTALEAALLPEQGMVVQFVSVAAHEGCAEIARGMCQVAAVQLGKRVLLLDEAISPPGPEMPMLASSAEATAHLSEAEKFITKMRGTELYLGLLREVATASPPMEAVRRFAAVLNDLRPVFDLVMVVPPPMQTDPFARVLARHIDGSVLVVEAEQTRGTVAAQMQDQISLGGGVVLGSVLNRRRQHLPRWLRRWV